LGKLSGVNTRYIGDVAFAGLYLLPGVVHYKASPRLTSDITNAPPNYWPSNAQGLHLILQNTHP